MLVTMPRIRRAMALASATLNLPARRAKVQFVPPCYWVAAARLNSDSVMLDLGLGFDADFSQAMIAQFGLTSIGFDPTRKHLPQLNELADRSGGRFRVRPLAIGAKRGEVTFHESKVNVSGSLLASHANVRHDATDDYQVQVITPADALAECPGGKADLIKMDIEGAELEALDAADDGVLRSCPQWIVEFHHDIVKGGSFVQTRARIRRFQGLGFHVYTRDNVNFLFYTP
jgi:FkbM family methyltransferase